MTNTVKQCGTINLLDRQTYDQQTPTDEALWAVDEETDTTYKSFVAGLGMPSETWENVSLPASGGYVIAPANGYYCISGTGQTLYLGIEDSNGASTLETWTSNSGTFLPIYKGQKCIVGYSAAPSTFRFVYAQGEI